MSTKEDVSALGLAMAPANSVDFQDSIQNLTKLRELTKRLASLLEDPHPGLYTWNEMLDKVLDEIGQFHSSGRA